MKDNQNKKKLTFLWALWGIMLAVLLIGQSDMQAAKAAADTTAANNIILFIGDGMGPEHVKAGGMFANGAAGSLSFESFPYETTMTHDNVDGGVTDSAASSTAMATGIKVENGVISVVSSSNATELQTQLEIYSALGKSTGLVSTAHITGATPAGFGAHETSRNNKDEIFDDYIMQTTPTLFLGGGGSSYGFDSSAAVAQGYTVVDTRDELLALNTESAIKVAGGFGDAYYIPAEGMSGRSDQLPTLPEMTKTALKILDNDPDGFFLVVEHGGTDNYSHANNTEGVVRSADELSRAVEEAIAWQAGHPDTIILVTADHETGELLVTETTPQAGEVPDVYWGSTGHSHTPVPVYAMGVGAEQLPPREQATPKEEIDNTDIFDILGPEGSATVSFQDGVAGYSGTRDTMLSQEDPTDNFGSEVDCLVDGDDPSDDGLDKSALLYWDVSTLDPGETIAAAAITLTVTDGSDDSYGVYALKQPWIETQATWEKYDANDWQLPGALGTDDRDWTLIGTLSAPGTGETTIALNATGVGVVQGWVNGKLENYGVVISDASENDGIDFYCRETTTPENRPKLTVNYGEDALDLVDWIWSGAVTTNSAVVNARTRTSSKEVGLLVSQYVDLSSAKTFGPLTASDDSNNTVSFDLTDLEPDRLYHYAVSVGDEVDDLHRGSFQTFPDGPFSFSFAISGDAHQGSNMPVFDAVREEQTRFFISPGDFMYSDITTNDVDEYRTAFGQTLRASRQSDLYRSMPIAYMWDDHDYAGNNSDTNASSKPAARAAYQEIVPHYPLGAGSGNVPIYQAFTVGRARFIMTDLRSERNAEAGSMMGSTQKEWFKKQLLVAKQNGSTPIFWLSSVPWIADASDSDNKDNWGGFATEREEIAKFIDDNEIKNVVILSADAHMLAVDDGSNSNYATDTGKAFPVFQAAALNRGGSVKGGPYSEGTYPNPTEDDGQYAIVQVTDNGTDVVGVRYIGKRLAAETTFSLFSTSAVAATTTHIDWSVEMDASIPTAVSLQDFSAAASSSSNVPVSFFILLSIGLTLGALHIARRRH